MRYALTNAVIYTGHSVLYDAAVIVEGNKIAAVMPKDQLDRHIKKIDLNGHNLTAGFIDLQLNGCGGVMFNEDISVQTLEIMQATNLKSGTTSYLPTLITSSDEDMRAAVQVMRHYLAKYQYQALGLHFEGPYLSVSKKGVHQEDFIREISSDMKDFLLANSDVITKITIAAENPTMQYAPEFVSKGIVVSIGHSNATYEQTKKAIKLGASFATHLHNAMSPISSGRDMGVVGAVLESDDLYAGIIADGLHIEFGNIKIDKCIKGNKLCLVTDATAAAGANIDSFKFVGKTVYVQEGKCYEANGTLGGSAVTMIESIRNVVTQVGIPLEETLRMCNLYPARAIGIDNHLGSIDTGKIANLTAFTNQFQIIGTAVNGEWQHHI